MVWGGAGRACGTRVRPTPISVPCAWGVLDDGAVPEAAAERFARLTAAVVSAGGAVVLPATAALLSSPAYLDTLGSGLKVQVSLAYGQTATPGLHVMETPTRHWVETLTGLGATGVEIMVAHVSGSPVQAHPMIPLLQVASDAAAAWRADMDLTMREDEPWTETLLPLVLSVASRAYTPKLYEQGQYGLPGVARAVGYFDVTAKSDFTRRGTGGRREPACRAPGGGRAPG